MPSAGLTPGGPSSEAVYQGFSKKGQQTTYLSGPVSGAGFEYCQYSEKRCGQPGGENRARQIGKPRAALIDVLLWFPRAGNRRIPVRISLE